LFFEKLQLMATYFSLKKVYKFFEISVLSGYFPFFTLEFFRLLPEF